MLPNAPTPAPSADDQTETLRYAERLLQACRWTEARATLHRLAATAPGISHYRALLAYARGEEAAERGDLPRARDEWRRALILEPTYAAPKAALQRAGSSSVFGRLFGRLRGRA
jgi:hypothetical protein